MTLLTLLALSIFLIVIPRFTSIKMAVTKRKSRVLLTFCKKVPKCQKCQCKFLHDFLTFPKISRQFFDYFPKLVDTLPNFVDTFLKK